jgi:hypothetical protein
VNDGDRQRDDVGGGGKHSWVELTMGRVKEGVVSRQTLEPGS